MNALHSTLQEGDSAVITGAAQGIGRAVALRLAAMGVKLSLWDTRLEGAEETAELCRKKGVRAHAFHVDVANWHEVQAAANNTQAAIKAPFALVSNAGIFLRSRILQTDPSTWERTLQVNLIGAFHCVRALGPMMVDAKRGAIVTVASGRALQGTPNGAHYAASKAGLVSFTKSAALELASSGIRANCVIPGVTETAQPLENTNIEELRGRGKKIPLGRIGQPEDIAGVVAFLLSADAAYMTGQAVAVNGGAQMIP